MGAELFQVCIWDHGQRISHLSKTASVLDCTRFHSLLTGSPSSHKDTFVWGWMPNYCCWMGDISEGCLFNHSVDITSQIILWENDFKLELAMKTVIFKTGNTSKSFWIYSRNTKLGWHLTINSFHHNHRNKTVSSSQCMQKKPFMKFSIQPWWNS